MKIIYLTKLYLSLALTFACFLYIGCTGDVEGNVDKGIGLRDVNVRFTFSLVGEVSPVTRSIVFTSGEDELGSSFSDSIPEALPVKTKASGVDESTVKTLWLGQYDASGNLLIAHYLTDITGNEVKVQLKESPNSSLRFVGNAGDLGKVLTLTAFNDTKINYGTGGLTTSVGLPVNQSCANIAQLDDQYISMNYKQSVALTRMVTKIQLNYTIKSGFTFTLKQLHLRSVPTQIQCDEPTGQVPGVAYQSFTVTPSSDASGTVEWYMPENKAGIISSGKDGYAASMRDKKGSTVSVPNATYIELIGDATVNGTTYKDVSFRIYPGNGINDYDLKRNTPYVVNLTLGGIDLSDPRVSVTVPDIVAPADIDAAVNSTTTMQVTARPGAAWTIALPAWLSALVDGKTNGAAGGALNFTGPAPVKFTAVTANPSSTERSQSFTIAEKSVTVKQKGSVLSATSKNKTIEPEAASYTDTDYSFSATNGLSWALGKDVTWMTLSGTTTGVVSTTTVNPVLNYSVTVNPSSSTRLAKVSARGGNAISATDAALEKQISAITQKGAVLTVPASSSVKAEITSKGTTSFIATKGLSWAVTSANWVKLTGTVNGTNNTTGISQGINYETTSTNPNAAVRSEYITVKVGNAVGGTDAGLTKTIKIDQAASAISAPGTVGTIAAAGGTVNFNVTATTGLGWTVARTSGWADFSISSGASGSGNGTVVIAAKQGAKSARSAVFTLTVTGASPARTYTITVNQAAYDGWHVPGYTSLEVCKGGWGTGTYLYKPAFDACNNLSYGGYSDWRLPSGAELQNMFKVKNDMNCNFSTRLYWGKSGWAADNSCGPHYAPYVSFSNGSLNNNYFCTPHSYFCVRGN